MRSELGSEQEQIHREEKVLSMVACVYNPSTPGRLRQENCEFKTSLGYIKKTASKKKRKKEKEKAQKQSLSFAILRIRKIFAKIGEGVRTRSWLGGFPMNLKRKSGHFTL
jgi:hypothetical protein